MLALIAIFGAATLALMVAVVYYRQHPVIKAASSTFAVIMVWDPSWPIWPSSRGRWRTTPPRAKTVCGFTIPFHVFMDPLIAKVRPYPAIFFSKHSR